MMRPGELVNIRFSGVVAFKAFCENIATVLKEGVFEVVKTDKFEGIMVEAMDKSRVCMVQGRLTGVVTYGKVGEYQFCVNMTNIITSLRNAHPQHFLELYILEDSTDVVLRVFEPQVRSYGPVFKLKTLDTRTEKIFLDTLHYSMFIEVDLGTFRNAIKTARDHKADTVMLRVLRPPPGESAAPSDPEGQQRHTVFFVIQYRSDEVECTFPFRSSTETLEGKPGAPQTIRTIEDDSAGDGCEGEMQQNFDAYEVLYSARFSIEYLIVFTKNMERHSLTLRVSKKIPLILDYPLGGGETNWIRFVLAPRVDDEE